MKTVVALGGEGIGDDPPRSGVMNRRPV